MKTIFIYSLLCATVLASCNPIDEDTREFIPGTYAISFKDSFSVVNDTFYINVLTTSGSDQYSVINKMSYQQIIDGQVQPLQRKGNRWTATYDDMSKTISVNQTGAVLAFDPAKQEMKLGTISYKKLKI